MRTIRLFVSSPGDVAPERQRVQWVADRLNGEFAHNLHIETILWETAIFNAHDGGFQPQIEKRARPADCDIVLTIFWSRLGTELPESFPERQPDGKPYPSGTAYEVLSALEARRANQHHPDVYVFRKDVPVTVASADTAARAEADRQWTRLQDFFASHFELPDKRILRVAERFREIGEFEKKVELLLRDWIKSNVSQGTVWPIETKGSPFRGLEPFDAKHADVYCGRDRKVWRAMDELVSAARRGKPFLLIPGASGSGKSSLMRAGMAPRLVRPGMVSGVDLWRTAVMRPGADGNPLLALARALFVTGDDKDDPGGFGPALPELSQGALGTPEQVAQSLTGPAEVVAAPIVAALDRVGQAETARRSFERPLQANLLLLVDQLEDIFAASVTPEQRAQFANLLAALVNTKRVWLIATLRGDMYEHMITERPFVVLKDICGQFDLGPPGADELDEIVHRSAEAAGLQYEERVVPDGAGGERRERLDDRLLQDAAGENTLPLLQFAFNLLFEKCWVGQESKVLTFAAYEGIGGLDGAINQTAEIALARLVRPGADVQFPLDPSVQEDVDRQINPRLEVLGRKLVVPVGQQQDSAAAAGARALTARLVPVAEARRDGPTGELIDALVHARILLAAHGEHGSSLRLAHDRVMTSWERARSLIEKNRDFYRVRDAVEHARQRWEEHKRSHEFVIPGGVQIAQAEDVVRRFGEEFDQATREFVAASGRRARRRQRNLMIVAVVSIICAIGATVGGILFYYERNYAIGQRDYANQTNNDTRDAFNGVITTLAQKLKDQNGMTVDTVEQTLEMVKPSVDKLAAKNPSDPEVQRLSASMHFEFAKAFQNLRALDRAQQEAQAALDIRNKLAAVRAAKPEWKEDQALSLEQLGDIRRERASNLAKLSDAGAPAEFDAARQLFGQAHDILEGLHNEDNENPTWAFDLSQNLVRSGDLKVMPDKDYPGAKENYQNALALIVEVVKREPDNVNWQRELSWDLNKVGDILCLTGDLDGGLVRYGQGLVTRRYVASQDTNNTLYKRDVAFSLEKIGKARCQKKDYVGAKEALLEAVALRQELVRADETQNLWLIEYAETLQQLGTCQQAAGQFDLAGGFFEMAVEKLQDKRVANDQRAKDDVARTSAACNDAIGRLSPEIRAKTPDVNALKTQLRDQAAANMATEVAQQGETREIDPLGDWNDLRATLMEAPAQQDQGN